MKKTLLLAAALAFPALAMAQSVPTSGSDRAAALRDEALNNDTLAWDILEGLTTEIGPRQAGTPAEARAREWAVRRLTQLGFSNVHVEPFDMPVWMRGVERAEIISLPPAFGADRARQQRRDAGERA